MQRNENFDLKINNFELFTTITKKKSDFPYIFSFFFKILVKGSKLLTFRSKFWFLDKIYPYFDLINIFHINKAYSLINFSFISDSDVTKSLRFWSLNNRQQFFKHVAHIWDLFGGLKSVCLKKKRKIWSETLWKK